MIYVRLFLASVGVALLGGCLGQGAASDADAGLAQAMRSEGYRYKSDVCRLVAETPMTLQYLDDSADIVACPKDVTLIGDIDGAELVFETEGYRVFSVPREAMG